MTKNVLDDIKNAALKDSKNRKDPRYLRAMGFLTRKGFLKSNRTLSESQQGKLRLKDALWAGKNLEPRILEVLPAVLARFPKEVISAGASKTLLKACEAIERRDSKGPTFMGITFEKYRVWGDLALIDQRTKPIKEKKIMRSFRLHPKAIHALEKQIKNTGLSGSKVLENFLLKAK